MRERAIYFSTEWFMSQRNILIEKIKQYCVKYGNFTLASNKTSNFYLDLKQYLLTSEGHRIAADCLGCRIRELNLNPDAVAGVALGGCSLASSLSFWSFSLPAIYIRKTPKSHGTQQLIESPVDLDGLKVVLVEDVATSGQSALKAAKILQEAKTEVVGVIAVLDRNEGAKKLFVDNGLIFDSLVNVEEILES